MARTKKEGKKSKKEKKDEEAVEAVPAAAEAQEKKKSKKEKKSKKDKKEKKREKDNEDTSAADATVKQQEEEPKKKEKKSKKDKKDKVRKADDDEETPKKKAKIEEPEEESTATTEKASSGPLANNPDGICKCFLGNLSWDIDDDGCKEFFKDCGAIEDLFWLTDKDSGKFKGAGFITFASPEGASKALALAGTDLMGRPIKIELANAPAKGKSPGKKRTFELSEKPEGCVTVFLGNLSFDIDDDQTKEFFKDCGEIKKIRWLSDRESGQFKGCGFIDFYETEAVDKATALNGRDLLGRAIRIDFAKSKTNSF